MGKSPNPTIAFARELHLEMKPSSARAAEPGRRASARKVKHGTFPDPSFAFPQGDAAAVKVPRDLLKACRLLLQLFSVSHVENTTQCIPSLESCTFPKIPARPCRSESLGICQSLRPQSHVCHLLLSIRQCCPTTLRACFLPTLCQRCHEDRWHWL